MATKAELEAELAKLKAQLAENTATTETDPDSDASEPPADAWEDVEHGHIEGIAEQIIEELEDFTVKKPLLLALGVFVLGYMIGRSR